MVASVLIWLQVYSIEISENSMFGATKHNPLLFRLKIMTVSLNNDIQSFFMLIEQ